MLTTYLADLHILKDPQIYEKYYCALPQWRKEKVDRIKSPKNKIQSLGAWSLFTAAVAQSPLDFQPLLESQEDFLEKTWINISHSGSYALCAISDDPAAKVGCDIECLHDFRESLARRCFCNSEYRHLMGTTDPKEQAELFYRYWVLKESFLKVTRQGLKLDTRSFEIAWTETGNPYLLKQPSEFPEVFCYQEYPSPNAEIKASMAICTTDTKIDPSLHILHL